eukprot:g28578.t1
MQRYGPPPSYPNLKIPGLNSPIPEVRTILLNVTGQEGNGAITVYNSGSGQAAPLVTMLEDGESHLSMKLAKTEEEELDRTPWGELEPSDEESSEEEEEEDE